MKKILTYTDAPEVYDGFGTHTVRADVGTSRRNEMVRLVSTPEEHVDWQRMQYASGLHLRMDMEDWKEDQASACPLVNVGAQ